MHFHMTDEMWWLVGRYGGGLIIAGVCWLVSRRWWPHRHDGWATLSGYVHACSHCGRLPAGATHAGSGGIPRAPGTPDPVSDWNLRMLAGSDRSEDREVTP